MADRYWVGGSSTWDTTVGTKWATSSGGAGGAAVPTAIDDVYLDASSGSVTVTVTTATTVTCRSLNCTGFTGTLRPEVSSNINIGDNSGGGAAVPASNIALFFSTGMIFNAFNSTIAFISTYTGGTPQTINSGGKSLNNINIGVANVTGCSYQLTGNDLMLSSTARSLTFISGGFDANNRNITAGAVRTGVSSASKSLNMGSGTWTVTGISNCWNFGTGAGSMPITPGTSTILFTDTSATVKTFTSQGYTFNNVEFTGGSGCTIAFAITSSPITFNSLRLANPGATITFSNNTTMVVSSFDVNGASGNPTSLLSSSTGATAISRFTLSKSSGTISCDYLVLGNSAATGGASWYAGANSSNNASYLAGNTGWIFTAPPLTSGNFFQLF